MCYVWNSCHTHEEHIKAVLKGESHNIPSMAHVADYSPNECKDALDKNEVPSLFPDDVLDEVETVNIL